MVDYLVCFPYSCAFTCCDTCASSHGDPESHRHLQTLNIKLDKTTLHQNKGPHNMSETPSFPSLQPDDSPQAMASDATTFQNYESNPGGLAGKVSRPCSIAEKLAVKADRFRTLLSPTEIELQREKRHKYLISLKLKEFRPESEEDLEDWVDAAAEQVKRNRISCELFQLAWIGAAAHDLSRIVGDVTRTNNYEDLVSKIAMALFPGENEHAYRLEKKLLNAPRCTSVVAARKWIDDHVSRYVRVCMRRDVICTMTDQKMTKLALRTLPAVLEDDIRSAWTPLTWDQLWERALRREQEYFNKNGKLPGVALTALPAEDAEMQPLGRQKRPAALPNRKEQDSNCLACGAKGHWRKNCDFRHYRCENCQRLGHISRVCPNLVVKDAKGRVDTRLEPKGSGTIVQQRKDKTGTEKLVSMETVLGAIKDTAERRAVKSAEARREKKKESGWVRKKREIPHPVGHATVSGASRVRPETSMETEEEDNTSDQVDEIMNALTTLAACDGLDRSRSCTVNVQAKVNGIPHPVVIDSGASKSLCSQETARALSLKTTSEEREFCGLGLVKGVRAESVPVDFAKRTCQVAFWVMAQQGLPTLIGANDLRELNVLIDPANDSLLDPVTLEVVALAQEKHEVPLPGSATEDSPPATKGQQEIERRSQLESKLEHLDGASRDAALKIFKEYEGVWLRPQSGGATAYQARFRVKGSPIKMKLRHLTEELKTELDRQVDEMLAAKVIRPSKSAWAAVPVFAKKKDGGWRLCLDYRRLNEQMEADRYPIPLLWEQVQSAAHHRYYICLDLNWGFWGLPLAEECRQYTAFVTHRGMYEFTVLPFGIKNSPPEFQRMMDSVLGSMYSEGVLCYIDDIIIFANDVTECLNLMRRVFELLLAAGLFIKLSKSLILHDQVKLLGHRVGCDGILPDKDKVRATMGRGTSQVEGPS